MASSTKRKAGKDGKGGGHGRDGGRRGPGAAPAGESGRALTFAQTPSIYQHRPLTVRASARTSGGRLPPGVRSSGRSLTPITTSDLRIHSQVRAALESGAPVVALESTVIAHGLPWPENLALGQELESIVRAAGAVPATVAVLDGVMRVGLEAAELEVLARGAGVEKLSRRNLAPAIAQRITGATTVSATMVIAHAAGIRVFATGGIGGVHRGDRTDVSADLAELARTPMIVVCAGAKAILDLPATLEWLETWGVPVIGYQTSEFPAFFSRTSGLPLETRADSPAEVAAIARAAWRNGISSAVLVTVPCPEPAAVPPERIDQAIAKALRDAERGGIRGRAVTPFLLKRVSELTGGESRAANLALLRNNAALAAEIATEN